MNILPIQVLDEGVLIPKIYLQNTSEVEVVVTADYFLIKPKASLLVNDAPNGHASHQVTGALSERDQALTVLHAGLPKPTIISPQEQQQRIAALKVSPAWDALPEREKAIAVLRTGGLLTELSQEEQQRAATCTAALEEVVESLSSGEGQPLSELIIEMRGPKG